MTARDILIRQIAGVLDWPSVFMGGPSAENLKRAERIVRFLEKEKYLVEDNG